MSTHQYKMCFCLHGNGGKSNGHCTRASAHLTIIKWESRLKIKISKPNSDQSFKDKNSNNKNCICCLNSDFYERELPPLAEPQKT